jgi:hypothetical protein
MVENCTPIIFTHTGTYDDFDPHLLSQVVNPRFPPVRVSANGVCHGGNLTIATSAIPLPWPGGCRSETLRPPLSVEFAFVGGVEYLSYVSAPPSKTLRIVEVDEEIPWPTGFRGRGSWVWGQTAHHAPGAPPSAASDQTPEGGCLM